MTKNRVEFKLVRKTSTDEWVVKVYIDGKFNEDKSYYTDDKTDAENTKKLMEKEYREHPERYISEEKKEENDKSNRQSTGDMILGELKKIHERLDILENGQDEDENENEDEGNDEGNNEENDDDDLFF